MHPLNWAIVIAYIAYMMYEGIRRSKSTKEIEGYFLGNRRLPWWAVGLSVMATQLSAVTMIGTTGQGATDGLRFVQLYFGLPIAMLILGVTIVPLLHRAKVYTAYEFLERRFNAPTRVLTAFLFLISRGLSCGVIISAPAVVFSAIFGWPIGWTVALIGVPAVAFTAIGGVQAVTWVDVKQMMLIVAALLTIVVVLLIKIPVSPAAALHIAGAAGRLRVFDFSPTLTNKYTFWSGVIGGTFLMLSYFGTDQSQAQRYLTAKSVDEARSSLLISAYWKIPLQALVLLVGVLVFVFYQFQRPPLLYNPADQRAVMAAQPAAYADLERRYGAAFPDHKPAMDTVRKEALSMVAQVTGKKPGDINDVNYIMPRFVLAYLPLGLAGLWVAAVLGAAMSAIAGELNSLSTTTVIDFYRRWIRPTAPDAHYLVVSKCATAMWGCSPASLRRTRSMGPR